MNTVVRMTYSIPVIHKGVGLEESTRCERLLVVVSLAAYTNKKNTFFVLKHNIQYNCTCLTGTSVFKESQL